MEVVKENFEQLVDSIILDIEKVINFLISV
jgi:hypothetical protein